MFKLVVLSALLAVAFARPGHLQSSPLLYTAPIVQEHGFAKVGDIVKSIPTAVSHQSSTVVHNTAHHVEPIVAPIVKTYAAAPVLKAIHTPLVHTYAAAEPLTAPAHFSYSAVAAPIAYHSAPLTYAAGW